MYDDRNNQIKETGILLPVNQTRVMKTMSLQIALNERCKDTIKYKPKKKKNAFHKQAT